MNLLAPCEPTLTRLWDQARGAGWAPRLLILPITTLASREGRALRQLEGRLCKAQGGLHQLSSDTSNHRICEQGGEGAAAAGEPAVQGAAQSARGTQHTPHVRAGARGCGVSRDVVGWVEGKQRRP